MKPVLRYAIVLSWLVFTTALTVWWYIYSLEQLNLLVELDVVALNELKRSQRMLRMEGFVLVLSIIGGGLTLVYLVFRDLKRSERLREFILTLTHEVKTPLASLRLQADSLEDDPTDAERAKIVRRILTDSRRLELQFENAVYLANIDHQRLFIEGVTLRESVESVLPDYNGLEVHLETDCELKADSLALKTIFSNLFRNAIKHGKATQVTISSQPKSDDAVTIRIRDDGSGMQGSLHDLGKQQRRRYHGSGSGIGLYLCDRLAEKMGGALRFPTHQKQDSSHGFTVELDLPGTLA